MARCNFRELQTLSLPIDPPPKPTCRRPIRMIEKNSKTLKSHQSLSLRQRNNTSHHQPDSHEPEISSDENYEDSGVNDDSLDKKTDSFKNKETPKECNSPSNRSHTPELNSVPDCTEQLASPLQYKKKKSTEKKTKNLPSGINFYFIFLIILPLMILGIFYFDFPIFNNNSKSNSKSNYLDPIKEEVKLFKERIKEISRKFPSQSHRTWLDIESGIIDIINGSQKIWTIVLYSNETRDISCLAKMLGKASSKALHSEESLELQACDMGEDYGAAIDSLRPKIIEKKAVVVYNVLEINPRAIQAFHTMCDREYPLVGGVVYVLTIITSGNIPEFEKPTKFIENQLTNRFINKVPKDKLQPLITRITDGPIIFVNRESNIAECPS